MKKNITFILWLISLTVYSQGEANIWYFGGRAGLDFNSGVPVPLTNSQMSAFAGCSVLSDATGQLLFYTDGKTVWNRNQQIMQNGTGLDGGLLSSQSAMIVQKPGSPNLFYVFTLDSSGGFDGYRYSVIDLLLDNGLGAITTKNSLIYTPSCEKISVVNHPNGKDFWVVTHGNRNTFYSHLVTSSGISNTPVISNVGLDIGSYLAVNGVTNGCMKLSPDGTKLAICHTYYIPEVELFDFNSTTGILSNPKVLVSPFINYGSIYSPIVPYGVEFSPNSKILYVSSFFNAISIYQFDLTTSNIATSKFDIIQTSNQLGAMQLGPDHKIYIAPNNSLSLSVINNPNTMGLGCNYQEYAISLGGYTHRSEFGLPSFNQSLFLNNEIEFQNTCLGNTTTISLSGNETLTSATWDFGDGNTSTDINPTHQYATEGTYTVSVTTTGTNGTNNYTKDIVISQVPSATKPNNLLICDTNNDGLHSFNLTTQNTAILNGLDSNLYNVTYYANTTDYANNITITTPTNYVNTTPYQQQIIIAQVSNKENTACTSTTNFDIDVFDSSKPSTTVPKISICDNSSVGTDTDGKIIFDLTQRATTILNGQSASQFTLSYFKDAALTQAIAIPNSYANTDPSETIYIKIANKDNVNCFSETSFPIEVLALPVITSVVSLKQCDDNVDGFSMFNLEEAIDKITINAAIETITFFRLPTDAQNNTNSISNATNYTNQTVSNDMVYARVTNANGCFRIAKLNLIVSTTQIPLNFAKSFTQCDDAILGTNTDGIASFDFKSVTSQVQNIFPIGQLLDITYYRNLTDALVEKNSITDISNYRNIDYPNTQNIYIRVDSQLNNDCLGLGSYITLNVEKIPIVQPRVLIHCDDNQDGKYAFDTTNLESQLLNGLANVSVDYFDPNNVPLPSPLPNPFNTASQTLKVVVTNNTPTACSFDSTIQFVVDILPEAFPVSANYTTICDDEADPNLQDGKYAFDTSTFQNSILGTQTGMIVKYFDGNNNPLPSPLPNPFVTASQNVKVEVINVLNTNCTATVTLPFIVNSIPKISLLGDELVCSNLPTFTKVLDAGLLNGSPTTNYSYSWSFNGNTIAGATNYTLTVNTAGLYTVAVTNNHGCSRTRTFTVVASDIAKITNIDIVDMAESNSVSVTISGLGDYVYSLDEENGVYQTENIFNNVSAGIHTIFVKDLNGCGITPKEVAVLGIPVFFTPNNDGYNDNWNIKGVNASFNANTIIYIFDRYGKLIKQINPLTQGWDGTSNGKQMPATDYWYSVQLEDGQVVKGHFSLKR